MSHQARLPHLGIVKHCQGLLSDRACNYTETYIYLLVADASPKMVVYTVYLHKYCECVQPI